MNIVRLAPFIPATDPPAGKKCRRLGRANANIARRKKAWFRIYCNKEEQTNQKGGCRETFP